MKKLSCKVIATVLAILVVISCSFTAFAAEGRYGDVNADANVNATDALAVLKHAVGLAYLDEDKLFWADVNADTTINATDALEILQYSIGKISRFSAEIVIPAPETKEDILALYADAVEKARAEIPAYKLKVTSEIIEAEINPSGPIALMFKPSQIEEMKQEMMTKDSYQTIYRQNTQGALLNLPVECAVTDPSVFKSITCTVLSDGNYQVDIKFKDETKPGANSPIVKLLGMPDFNTLKDTVENQGGNDIVIPNEDGEDIVITIEVTANDLRYKNASISCVISSETGEFVSIKVCADAVSDSTADLKLMGKMNNVSTARSTLEYSNFAY